MADLHRPKTYADLSRRVRRAFKWLREQGFVCKPNYECCGGCGMARLEDEECVKKGGKCVFWHSQDAEMARDDNKLYLVWGSSLADGWQICFALSHYGGLTVEWDGTVEHRMLVT